MSLIANPISVKPVVGIPARSASTSSSTAPPKRPSPYRLIPAHTFLAQFAPLHVAGWRLDLLPTSPAAPQTAEAGMVDLQDRRLVRLYEFESGKQGWKECMRFMHRLGEVVETQDAS